MPRWRTIRSITARGFQFPAPEGLSLSYLPHLLVAQAFIPPTERVEVAGFDFPGDNYAIRAEVLRRLNAMPAYRALFGQVFPEVRQGAPITFDMFGKAIAEFEFTLIFADAPIDQFARGKKNALTTDQKKGALLFFGKARCVECHAVSGPSNEMFSDFRRHVIGVPQIAPLIGNLTFDGPGQDEDFGLEQVTGNAADRYQFRTSPLRNVALQPAFFHNGSLHALGRCGAPSFGRVHLGAQLRPGPRRCRCRPRAFARPNRAGPGANRSAAGRANPLSDEEFG